MTIKRFTSKRLGFLHVRSTKVADHVAHRPQATGVHLIIPSTACKTVQAAAKYAGQSELVARLPSNTPAFSMQ